jgi:flagellar hook assembly protein FlgD
MANFTEFYFEHNQVNSPMDVSLEIIDMQGRVLKVLQDRVVPDGYRYGPIRWNGKSKDGFHLSSGIYVYKVVATALNGEVLEKSAKLIISK